MLSCLEGFLHNRQSISWVRCDVEHLNILPLQNSVVIIINLSPREKLITLSLGLPPGPTRKSDNFITTLLISLQMEFADSTSPNHRDLRPIASRSSGPVINLWSIDLDDLLGGTQSIIIIFGHKNSR